MCQRPSHKRIACGAVCTAVGEDPVISCAVGSAETVRMVTVVYKCRAESSGSVGSGGRIIVVAVERVICYIETVITRICCLIDYVKVNRAVTCRVLIVTRSCGEGRAVKTLNEEVYNVLAGIKILE